METVQKAEEEKVRGEGRMRGGGAEEGSQMLNATSRIAGDQEVDDRCKVIQLFYKDPFISRRHPITVFRKPLKCSSRSVQLSQLVVR